MANIFRALRSIDRPDVPGYLRAEAERLLVGDGEALVGWTDWLISIAADELWGGNVAAPPTPAVTASGKFSYAMSLILLALSYEIEADLAASAVRLRRQNALAAATRRIDCE